MITHRLDGRFRGLKDFPAADRPQVGRVFFAFRVMVGLGSLMILETAVGSFLWWRGTLFQTRWYLRFLRWSWPAGFVALLSGWIVTETGRQPWLIQGILRTAQASSNVATTAVATSFSLFVVIYVLVFSTGLRYIRRVLLQGPTAVAPATVLPNRPLSAALPSARTSRGVNP
jgi:cytochrome d ubiquinol oxidase subunit I